MMRAWTSLLALGFALAAPASAQNLLVNPDFDQIPFDTGWIELGTGSVTQLLGLGEPPPAVVFDVTGSETADLVQCVPVSGDTVYGFIARSFTSIASGASTNAVRLRWYGLEGCTNELSSFELGLETFPPGQFARRYLYRFLSPVAAQSAQVELETVAAGSHEIVYFDAIYLPEPGAIAAAVAAIGVLVVRRRRT